MLILILCVITNRKYRQKGNETFQNKQEKLLRLIIHQNLNIADSQNQINNKVYNFAYLHIQRHSMLENRQPLLSPPNNNSIKIVVRYAVHMHPLTQIQPPDLHEKERNSIFDITCQVLYTALPIFLCFFLNAGSGLINIFWIGNHDDLLSFASLCFGTIFANIFVYYIIENIGIGFSFVCTYFENQKVEVGYMYQKALAINCFVCILITPVIYLSDKVFNALEFNPDLVYEAGNYVWALVPSFYVYAFFQTTTSYLQTQGVIYPPVVFSLCGTTLHFFSSYYIIFHLQGGLIGAAWSKNITDALSALGLYLYIIYKQPTKDSWIEWDIKATNNIHRFLMQVMSYEIYTFLQVLAFQIMCIVACNLQTLHDISAHYVLSMTYLIIYFAYVAISHCINKQLSLSIEDNNSVDGVDIGIKTAQKKVSLGVLIVLILSSLIVVNIELNKERFLNIFTHDKEVQQKIVDSLYIFYSNLILSGLQVVLLGIVKTLQVTILWKISLISFYFIGLGSTILFGYYMEMGLYGIWLGWNIGTIVSLIFLIRYITVMDWSKTFAIVRDKFKTIEDNIRSSKIDLIEDDKNLESSREMKELK